MSSASENACRRLDDARFAAGVRDGVSRIADLIDRELALDDDVVHDGVTQDDVVAATTQPRALFTVLAAQLGPDPDAWQVTTVGAALELMHQATLCHYDVAEDEDDVAEDEDDVAEDAASEDGGAEGRAAYRARVSSAILTGDHRYATASRLGSRLGPEAFGVIAETFAEVVTGQMRQKRYTATHFENAEHHLRIAREKSGSLLAACGRLGALCAGAPDDVIARMGRLGHLVGVTVHLGSVEASGELPGIRAAAASHAARAHQELVELPDSEIRQAFSILVDSVYPGGESEQRSH